MVGIMIMALIGLGLLIYLTGYGITPDKPDDGTADDAVPVNVKTETGGDGDSQEA